MARTALKLGIDWVSRVRTFARSRFPGGRSVLRTFLISSFMLLGVPIVISTIVYVQAYGIIRAEINRANGEVLKQAMMAMDNRLQEVRNLAVSVVFNQTVNMLVQDPSIDAIHGHYYLVRQAINELRNYGLTKWYVDEVGVYLKQSDSVLTTNGLDDFNYYYGLENQRGLVFRQYVASESWRKLLEAEHVGEYVFLGDPVDGSDTRPFLYVVSLPIYRDKQKYATLFLALNRTRFYDALQSLGSADGAWGILINGQNEVLFSTRPLAGPLSVPYQDLRAGAGMVSGRIAGEAATIAYAASGFNDWKYLSVTPSRVYDEKISRTRNLIIACLLASLLLGSVFAWFLSRRNYRPIDELVSSVGRRIGSPPVKGYNEYRYIKDAMESTFGENEKINELLRQQNALMRSTFLMKLMKGRIEDPVRIERSLDSYQLHFALDGFAVILFSIMDLGSLQQREDSPSSGDPVDIAQSLMAGIVEEVVRRRSHGCVAEVDRMLGCIVNFASGHREESRRELTMIAQEAIDLIHEACGMTVLAGVSDPHESYFGIPVAYQEAMSVMEYQRALEIDDVLSYDQLRTSSGSYNYPIEVEHQLINLIKGGDLEASRAIVDDVFEKNFAHGAVSKDMTRCLVFDLASTMLKTMSEVSTPVDESFLQGLDIAGRLLSCEKIADMKQQMTGILEQICDYIQENRKTRRDTYITSVVRYIDSNYQDANLSVSGIAEQFHLTPTYLIRLFREQTGEGVFHYVTKIRMARAKDLLKDAGHNINDVAARVGYHSNTAFIRAFKKHEGVTPGAYRGTA